MLPKVSIVIPVFNGSNYLREAIESALSQTYQNTEVIVVNDGSTDQGRTEAIAKSYADRIRYFAKENGGVSSALNHGIRNMTGEWFAWLSHDDLFSRNRIETDLLLIAQHPEARATFCMAASIDPSGKLIAESTYPIQQVNNPRDAMLLGGVDMCTVTVHRSCFDQVGLFNESNRTTQDVEMSLRLSARFRLFFNLKATTYRREHPNRGIHTQSEQHKKDTQLLCDFIHRELSFRDFFPDLSENEHEISRAWVWLGNLYHGFGSHQYADECYLRAIAVRRSFLVRLLKTVKFKAERSPVPALRRLAKLAAPRRKVSFASRS